MTANDPYTPPRNWRGYAMTAVWIAAALVILAARYARRAGAYVRRALLTMRETWRVALLSVVVVGTTAAALATWATLSGVRVAVPGAGVLRVEAASVGPVALPTTAGSGAGEAQNLQDGYVGVVPTAEAPMLEYAAPGGPDNGAIPSWLPPGLAAWWPDIVAAAHEHGLDSHAWGAIVAIECPWGDPNCGSQAGAMGLAQIVAGTATDIAAKSGLPCDSNPFDGSTSLRCGAFHFAELVRMNADLWTAGDDLPTLLAAAVSYNAGPGAQPRQAVRAAALAGGDLCAGVSFAETYNYCVRYRDMWRATLADRAAPNTTPAIGGGQEGVANGD